MNNDIFDYDLLEEFLTEELEKGAIVGGNNGEIFNEFLRLVEYTKYLELKLSGIKNIIQDESDYQL